MGLFGSKPRCDRLTLLSLSPLFEEYLRYQIQLGKESENDIDGGIDLATYNKCKSLLSDQREVLRRIYSVWNKSSYFTDHLVQSIEATEKMLDNMYAWKNWMVKEFGKDVDVIKDMRFQGKYIKFRDANRILGGISDETFKAGMNRLVEATNWEPSSELINAM